MFVALRSSSFAPIFMQKGGRCDYTGPLAGPVNECLNIRRPTTIGYMRKYGAGMEVTLSRQVGTYEVF